MNNAGPEFNIEVGVNKGKYNIKFTHHTIVDLKNVN